MIFDYTIIFEIEFNHFNNTPLIWAAKLGNADIVEHLLSQPTIDINSKNILILKHSQNFKSNFFHHI